MIKLTILLLLGLVGALIATSTNIVLSGVVGHVYVVIMSSMFFGGFLVLFWEALRLDV
jgi:hypothetical protein